MTGTWAKGQSLRGRARGPGCVERKRQRHWHPTGQSWVQAQLLPVRLPAGPWAWAPATHEGGLEEFRAWPSDPVHGPRSLCHCPCKHVNLNQAPGPQRGHGAQEPPIIPATGSVPRDRKWPLLLQDHLPDPALPPATPQWHSRRHQGCGRPASCAPNPDVPCHSLLRERRSRAPPSWPPRKLALSSLGGGPRRCHQSRQHTLHQNRPPRWRGFGQGLGEHHAAI